MLIAGGLAAIVATTLYTSSDTPPNLEQMIATPETQTIYYNNETLDLIKTKPELIELWYNRYTEVDNKTYGNGYLCLSFTMESSLEWKQFSGYNGLYPVVSLSYPYHTYNAVFVSGDYKDINNWVFFEPRHGRRIEIGRSLYHFPINIDLIWEVVMGNDNRIIGNNPELRLVWDKQNEDGELRTLGKGGRFYRVDELNNAAYLRPDTPK